MVHRGEAVGSRGQRKCALLARLVLDANRTVSIDALVDALWGERWPSTAVKMVHIYVSQLRKVLPSGALQTRPPGYRLEVAPEALDLLRFERLSKAGEATGERVWRLPLDPLYDEMIKGRYGDIMNSVEGRKAHSITAAAFLHRFAGDVPWAHLDIAGVSDGLGRPYAAKGASGWGVRLLLELAARMAEWTSTSRPTTS